MGNYWIEQKCARFLLWWRSGEIAIEPWANFREEFLDELSQHIGGWGPNIAANVEYAIQRINWRMTSPDTAVDNHGAIELTLAKYGFAKLPPIIPPPPYWPPHKWSVKLQRWEPVDAEHAERYRKFEKRMQQLDDDRLADDNRSKPNPWVGAVVAASKTLATDKEQMQGWFEVILSQQQMYGYPTKDLEQLFKQLEEAKDLPEFLKAIS
jgi:hypothetical protein